MSIVAFKRKTAAQYNNLSVGQKQFSINGTRRLQGYVGQNVISRSFPKTPMVGNTKKGHGGCCGKYAQGQNVSPLCAGDWTNDENAVKSSVLSNGGQLELRFPPYSPDATIVKPDDGQNTSTSQQYTQLLAALTANQVKQYCRSSAETPVQHSTNDPLFTTGNNYQQKSRRCPTFTTKDPSLYTSVNSGSYTQSLQLQTACSDRQKMVQPRVSNMPPFGATVQQQPEDRALATKYEPISRNFYLSSVKRLNPPCCKA